ncbi:thioredoxin-1 [Aphelenchoides avenae]|nr:thioredoxin-1 [Aphelenchus avenae]
MSELLEGVTLVQHDGNEVPADDALRGKLVVLFFSSGYCPPCGKFNPPTVTDSPVCPERNVSPVLKKFYETLQAAGKSIEVVFVSQDRSAEELLEYYQSQQGPWSYLKFGDPHIKTLYEKYEVKEIPDFKVILPNGDVIVGKEALCDIARGSDPIELFEKWQAGSK